MYKVRIIYGSDDTIDSSDVITNFYNDYSAKIISKGADDGVYYVDNFPKDIVCRVKNNDTVESLAAMGIVVDASELYENNVIISKNLIGKVYTVRPLDTIERVSRVCGVTVAEIIKLNHLKSTKLFVGQRLFINSSDNLIDNKC